MSRPSLITTAPAVQLCDRCQRVVLKGVSEGLTTYTDTSVLDLSSQIRATLAGIWLYWLHPTGLYHIDQSRARSAHLWRVVPAHRCEVLWPPSSTRLPAPAPAPTDTPPY